jgi:V/A-type H+/Na+-transporting ATPase subunit K
MVVDIAVGLIGIAAGLAMGLAGIGGAYGEAAIGAAAMGATAENPSLFVRGLILTVLPELIAVLGFVIAFLLIGKM